MKTSLLLAMAGVLCLGSADVSAGDVKSNWATHCLACHGPDGRGQTKAGRIAGAKDQTDHKYQASLTDEKMFKSIKEGLKEGEKERMKPFKEKLSDDEIKALVAFVRQFRKQ